MGCCGGSSPALKASIKLPSLNVASALEVTRSQFKQTADPFVIERRIKECNKCAYLHPQSLCKKCGCYVVAKVGALTETCPLRRW